ncbi:MAG: VTC domain-containing protein [Deltaproteobacteria bacterium]
MAGSYMTQLSGGQASEMDFRDAAMKRRTFNDRIEEKYQVDISENEVAGLWRDLNSFLRPYGLVPVQEITSVGSVYFDNKDCDLLRYSLLGRLMLVRLRVYEAYGRYPEPLSAFWVEVKTAKDGRRQKKRFRLNKSALVDFLEGKDAGESVFSSNRHEANKDLVRDLYRESQETVLTMGVKPMLMVVYKRVAFQSEVERLSIDWDLKYYNVTTAVYDLYSWKDLIEPPTGKADNVILELKYLQGDVPNWFHILQQRYPIRRREYLKPVEGMGFLFRGPLGSHKEANRLLPMIDAYMVNSQLG